MKKFEQKSKTLNINIYETIKVRDSFELKSFTNSAKKFVTHIINGWFPSKREDLSPEGVQKERVVDRKNNNYKEFITDSKTGRIIRNVQEKLTDHNL